MPRTLAIGLSGQVGAALQPLLPPTLLPMLALSRMPQGALPGVEWRQGTLDTLDVLPEGIDTLLSLGPLDALAHWLARTQPALARIVALSSTGREHKRESLDPRERDEARRLAEAEAALFEFGARRGVVVTVLRPTLLYGNGRDRSLSRLAARARRWRVLPLPSSATGLRQPVHVEDIARAVVACVDAPASFGRAFDLPGGEALAFDTMVARYLQVHAPGTRLLRLPAPLFVAAGALAGLAGRGQGLRGWLGRASQDQGADAAAAREAFGFAPRAFLP
jgi:nucleoside-diphosphate-sugar epimerase